MQSSADQAQPELTRTPLNVFQRLVRQWERLHPYNAGQILKIAGPADFAKLSATWEETLRALGLGRVEFIGQQFHHVNLNGEFGRYPITVLPAGADLCAHISQELNRPFDDAAEPPFRPFVLDCGNHHYTGIIYHHWVADSVSIRTVLREWFYRMHAPERARTKPLKHASSGYWSVFGPGRTNWTIDGGVMSSARWTTRNRQVMRLRQPGYAEFNVRFALHDLPDNLLCPLLEYARANEATLNDVFMAVIAQVCHRYVPLHRTAKRTDLALGTIVDLRPYSREDLSDTFGLFLGFTSTVCRPEDLTDFPRLLRTIATQSRHHKESGVPLSSPLRMLAGLTMGRFMGRERIIDFYRKRIPLAGGISNVNLNRSWAGEFHPAPLLDYVRVSPTGPLMPLVFTPTTLGEKMHFGLTYRPALVNRADEMAGYFTERLTQLAEMSA